MGDTDPATYETACLLKHLGELKNVHMLKEYPFSTFHMLKEYPFSTFHMFKEYPFSTNAVQSSWFDYGDDDAASMKQLVLK